MAVDRASGLGFRERVARRCFQVVNHLAVRMIPAGVPTGARNVLLIVRGRKSGIERTTPVTVPATGGHVYVQATYGATGWGRNLRAAGEATVVLPGGRRRVVRAIEIPTDEAATILWETLRPYHRSRLLRRVLGPRLRPPVAILNQVHVRVDDTREDYVGQAERHPLFELVPV
jgi:deazaflavin-dependent oxidoreductase (nitroreductase family)